MPSKKEKIRPEIRNAIIRYFESNPRQAYHYKHVASGLGDIGMENKKRLSHILYTLARENILIEAYKGKFKISPSYLKSKEPKQPVIEGSVDMKQTGKAYVITDALMEDVRINPNNTGYALHEDYVKVRLFPQRKDHKIEGEIIEVLQRSKKQVVGIIKRSEKFAFLLPDNKAMHVDIFIANENLGGASDGDKAVAEIVQWTPPAKNPFGKVVEVLGKPGNNDVEMHAILAEHNLPFRFPDKVAQEAQRLPVEISEEEIAARKDFRDVVTFTIDPTDAKDFDDALSVRRLEENIWEIGVHIADVTHYVQPDTLIEKEARQRATSIYLVDRTVPMLPEKLSNMVCSLRPNEDKLTYSVVFNMNEKGRVLKSWIGKTVIKSNHRFDYEDVQKIIDTGDGPFFEQITLLNRLAKINREKRMRAGAIDFDTQEVEFVLSSSGKPVSLFIKEQKDAHKLVEEFMLLANRTVAEKVGRVRGAQKPKTFVYRVHDIPNPEKLHALTNFVAKLGYKMKTDTRANISSSFNKLLQQSRGKGEENLIDALTIRSMAKAEYATVNIGHYGLAFNSYTHFTSPIRRYPDMMVHRLLTAYANGASSADQTFYDELCKHSTDMEIKAQEAERDSVKYKQIEYMADKLGEEFEGLISGVSKWGIYVEIKENKCEGMVKLRDMADDFYTLDEENYQVIGNNTGKTYKLGSPIRIRIIKADLHKKELDFALVE